MPEFPPMRESLPTSQDAQKNLVVVHLESVCTELLRRFAADFPTLIETLERSVSFGNFYASAPSSIKSFCDLLYGNTSEMDHVVNWDDPSNRPLGRERHLMDVLREQGYRTYGLGYPVIWRDDINIWQLFGEGTFDWLESRSDFDGALDAMLAERASGDDERPFAAYVWDLRSHLSYSDEQKPAELRGFERLRAGYRATDDTLARVLQALRNHGLEDSTAVVGFGDHGDQFWSHGLYFGFCHAFEPYTEVIRTPAFVLDPGREPAVIDDLVSLVDLKATCLEVLGVEIPETRRWDSGSSPLSQAASPRQFAHCQSLFANQQPNKALPKAWSVTGAEYHLVLTWFGLELYAHHMDPGNHNNLLSFFDLDEDGQLHFDNRGATHSHLRNTLNEAQVQDICSAFYSLRTEMVQLLRNKYTDLEEQPRRAGSPRLRPSVATANSPSRVHLESETTSILMTHQKTSAPSWCRFLQGEGPPTIDSSPLTLWAPASLGLTMGNSDGESDGMKNDPQQDLRDRRRKHRLVGALLGLTVSVAAAWFTVRGVEWACCATGPRLRRCSLAALRPRGRHC